MKKRFTQLIALSFATVLLVACGSGKQDSNSSGSSTATPSQSKTASTENTSAEDFTPTQNETESQTKPVVADPHKDMVRSPLTGLWVSKEIGTRTPVAVMINNIQAAIPQSGIRHADVLLESYAEGGITRLTAIFDDYENIEKLGSVRSCRTYYLFFAKEFEASYFYFGTSDYALDYLADPNMRGVNLMADNFYYRDSNKKAPHNVYLTSQNIADAISATGMSTTYPENYQSPFLFNTNDDTEITLSTSATACKYFAPGYVNNKPYFTYDESSKTYKRFQYGQAHIDADTNEQLAFKNLLVKYVTGGKWPNGTPNYDNTGSGDGLFITNGQVVNITWKKETETGPTKYYYPDGTEVTLNQGKTYVCYIESGSKSKVVVSETIQ